MQDLQCRCKAHGPTVKLLMTGACGALRIAPDDNLLDAHSNPASFRPAQGLQRRLGHATGSRDTADRVPEQGAKGLSRLAIGERLSHCCF